MRFTSITAAVALLLAPVALADLPPGDWSGETTVTVTSSYSTTLTITKTLTFAHANITSSSAHPTGWNATSATTGAATTVNKPTLTGSLTSTSAVAIATATGAASAQEINFAVAALAGAAAMFWGSL
ncbi:hypothetical protein LTR84_012828 [Exophiala bonariae]|uniref:Uncharacterized protein n=1 Tax=Exophiala bonariae TaxID=1690606 RepID=A0AAV9MRQ8_9EURO|nr:hypothetical protein LTR84_012828 [Exophiala bonariae]